MSHAVPMYCRAPSDYRYALDAATTLVPPGCEPLVICNVPQLMAEVGLRFPSSASAFTARTAIWVEPLAETWHKDMNSLVDALSSDALLIVIASQPLARLVPERRSWQAAGLGLKPGGLRRLRRAAVRAGFRLDAIYGFHSLVAIGLNAVSAAADRWRRPELADRLHFAGRFKYRTNGHMATLATVALLLYTKERVT